MRDGPVEAGAQALAAAGRTVAPDRAVHSLHAYFLRAGDVDHPIVYEVDRTRRQPAVTQETAGQTVDVGARRESRGAAPALGL